LITFTCLPFLRYFVSFFFPQPLCERSRGRARLCKTNIFPLFGQCLFHNFLRAPLRGRCFYLRSSFTVPFLSCWSFPTFLSLYTLTSYSRIRRPFYEIPFHLPVHPSKPAFAPLFALTYFSLGKSTAFVFFTASDCPITGSTPGETIGLTELPFITPYIPFIFSFPIRRGPHQALGLFPRFPLLVVSPVHFV